MEAAVNRPTILLVEDNLITRKMVRIALEGEGFVVVESADAATALSNAARELPSLILQDIVLPDLNGFDLIREFRKLPGGLEIPIIAMTGLVSRAEEPRFASDGFNELLIKPVEPSRLVEVVRNYLPDRSALLRRPGNQRHVLLVDDDPVQMKLTRLHLTERGFHVTTACDGVDAFESALATPPDAILSDVMMPRADGFTLCQRVRSDDRLGEIPVVLMSAHYLEDEDRALARNVGADALLSRAWDIGAIIDSLEQCLSADRASPRANNEPALKDQHQLRLVRQLERQAALNAGLSQRCALQSGIATIVRRLAEVLGRHSDLNRALEETLHTLLDVAGGSTGALYLCDATNSWRLAAHVGFGHGGEDFFGHPELIEHALKAEEWVALSATGHGRDALSALDVRSGMLVPLVAQDNRVGVLFLAFRSDEGLDRDRVELARTVGVQIAYTVALQDAFETVTKSERKYEFLFQNANDVISLLTPEGLILDVNRRCEEMIQLPREQIIGRYISDFAAPGREDQNAEEFRTSTSSGATPRVKVRRCDGSIRQVEFSNAPIDVEGDRRVFSIGRDVTESVAGEAKRKNLEQQMHQMQRLEAVGQLTGGVAHDLNNILAVILGNSHFLLESLSEHDPRRLDAEEIKKAGDRAASLVRQLLAFSRRQVLEPTIVDLNVVVRDLGKMLRLLIGEDIDFSIASAADLGSVRVDTGQIEQVIMNLVVNSRDAMPTGGKLSIETANVEFDETHAAAHVHAHPGKFVMIAVSDTGCGMDADTQRRVFEPFFTTKEKDKGTGLGLSTTYGIVKQSGGYIWLYSEPGHGTVFKVYLPRVDERPGALDHARMTRSDYRGSETILLVEDDDAVRTAVSRILSTCGYRVLAARNGDEAFAISKCHEDSIHLVLSDVIVPGMSGPEIVKLVRTRCTTARAIFMSGYTDHAILQNGVLPSGMNFIQKPFSPNAVAKKVREVLDEQPSE